MWLTERKRRCGKEHDWRADGLDKYSASVCAHADWVVCWVNIGVNIDLLLCALVGSDIAYKAIYWGSSRSTGGPLSGLFFRIFLGRLSLLSSVRCDGFRRGSNDNNSVFLFGRGS